MIFPWYISSRRILLCFIIWRIASGILLAQRQIGSCTEGGARTDRCHKDGTQYVKDGNHSHLVTLYCSNLWRMECPQYTESHSISGSHCIISIWLNRYLCCSLQCHPCDLAAHGGKMHFFRAQMSCACHAFAAESKSSKLRRWSSLVHHGKRSCFALCYHCSNTNQDWNRIWTKPLITWWPILLRRSVHSWDTIGSVAAGCIPMCCWLVMLVYD